MHLGAGITSNQYQFPRSHNPYYVFDDDRTTAWRAEVGYLWDPGKSGGFHLGLAGVYNDLGELKQNNAGTSHYPGDGNIPGFTDYYDIQFKYSAQTFGVLLVVEQEITRWMDFVFKIGPAYLQYELKTDSTVYTEYTDLSEPRDYSHDWKSDSEEYGALAQIGLTFFPIEQLGLELAMQTIGWQTDRYPGANDWYYVNTLSLSAQYRF